jgi:signal transduction histidine kinase
MKKLSNAREQSIELLRELKEIYYTLNNYYLERFRITKILERDADRILRTTGTQVKIDANGFTKQLNDNEGVVLHRVCRELLTNMLQHAEATEVTLSITDCFKGIEPKYSHNGKGFGPLHYSTYSKAETV